MLRKVIGKYYWFLQSKLLNKSSLFGNLFRNIIINEFHKIYYYYNYNSKSTRENTFWLGIPCLSLKCPIDLWIYQEIIHEVRPDVIIECGTAWGGTAYFFLASLCDLIGKGKVITIDIEERVGRPQYNGIIYIQYSSTFKEIVEKVKSTINKNDKVMVILDSDHRKEHVLKKLGIYSKFVTKDSYIIVENSNINQHPVLPKYEPRPMEAIKEFLKENKNLVIDKIKEKIYII